MTSAAKMVKCALQIQTTILPVALKGKNSKPGIVYFQTPGPLTSTRHPTSAVCTGTAPVSAPTASAGSPSYIPNSYFPFPYALTTFGNSASCSAAVQSCSKNYHACLTKLQSGDGYHVTVAVPGNTGTTVTGGGANLPSSQATSVCSSLSSQACEALDSATCASFGHSSGTFKFAPTSLSWLLLLWAVHLLC